MPTTRAAACIDTRTSLPRLLYHMRLNKSNEKLQTCRSHSRHQDMNATRIKLERVLHHRNSSQYCGFRRLGIALDAKTNQLHHALVHEAGMVCLDVETGQVISSRSMPGTSGAKDCSFSAPENICCCAVGRSLICFDARQPSIAIQMHAIDSAISAISCSNDGRYIAYASSDSTVGLFSLRMSSVVRPGLFHTSCVNSCSFQEDNSGFWTAVICVLADLHINESQSSRAPIEWLASSKQKQGQVS